jgi:hypothetical protein
MAWFICGKCGCKFMDAKAFASHPCCRHLGKH